MPLNQDRPGPYAPPTAILEVINRRRDRGLTAPINADVLVRAGIPDSLIPRTLQSLQTLDLIDEGGNPTDTFEALRLAPTAEFQARLQEWLKSAYADVFAFVDPSQDDDTKIQDAFRAYNPAGQQRRMVILFRELCAAAGLTPPKAAASAKQSSTPRLRTAAPPTKKLTLNKVMPKGPAMKVSLDLPPALSGLMESVPGPQVGWTAAERDKFLATFKAVLDFCIPVVERSDENVSGGQKEAAA